MASVASAAPRRSRPPARVGSRVSGTWRTAATTTKAPERKIDQEDRAPRHRVGQVPADGGADRARDRTQACPRADRPGAVIGMKDRLDDRKAPWGKESAPDPLNEPGTNEQPDRRGGRAQRRRGHEDHRPQDENATPAVDVAERTAHQDKRRERKHIAVQRPLQPRDARAEITADRRQRHVDDRRLQQDHRVAQHRHRQHPAAGGRGKPHRAGLWSLIPQCHGLAARSAQ